MFIVIVITSVITNNPVYIVQYSILKLHELTSYMASIILVKIFYYVFFKYYVANNNSIQ